MSQASGALPTADVSTMRLTAQRSTRTGTDANGDANGGGARHPVHDRRKPVIKTPRPERQKQEATRPESLSAPAVPSDAPRALHLHGRRP